MTRALAVFALLAATTLTAQHREAIEVRIVELEVTVLDRAGKPVQDLTRDDFTVRIGKRDVPVANFFAVRDGAILADERAPVPRPTEEVAPVTSIPTSLVIFVDELHLGQRSRTRAIEAVRRYVSANVGPNMTATLIRYKGEADVRVRPTERPGYILAELEKIEREPSVDETVGEREQMMRDMEAILLADKSYARGKNQDLVFNQLDHYARRRGKEVDRTLVALEEAIDLASTFAGRKVLLYVSDGLPMEPAVEMFDYWDRLYRNSTQQDWKDELTHRNNSSASMQYDRTKEFERLVRAAQRADVAIFSFDAGGARGYEDQRINTTLSQQNLRSGLQYAAGETGGRYVANENDIDKLLAKMSEQFSTYYSIGVTPQRGEIRIAVKNRPELRVITAKRVPPKSPADEMEQDVRRRLYTRAEDNPLRANLQVGSAARVDGQCVVPVRVVVPEPVPPTAMLDLHVVMLNERNDETALQHMSVPSESPRLAHTMMMRIRPERQVLSLAVSNPLSGESSFLQSDIDGTRCH